MEVKLYGKFKDISAIIQQAIVAGYGHLPAAVAIKLYLARN